MANYTTTGSDTFPADHIIKFEYARSATDVNGASTSGGTWVISTGMVVSITPTYSTSLIYLIFQAGGMVYGPVGDVRVKIQGTSTGVVTDQRRYGYVNSADWKPVPYSIHCIDGPLGNTDAQTYQMYTATSLSVNVGDLRVNPDAGTGTRSGHAMAMEIRQ